FEVEAVDREAIASRGRQSLCESNLEVTGAGAHADKTAHSRRRAAPRARTADCLWGQRSGEAASVGAVFASAGVVAALQMLLEEMIRIRGADRFELWSEVAIGPVVKNRRQVVHCFAARKKEALHP